jgi:type II restriction/modification system DNA methylase subunit YeeA
VIALRLPPNAILPDNADMPPPPESKSASAVQTPAQFVAKWQPVQLSERAASQEHFMDLCRLLGQPTPAEHDATGAEYTFEKGVRPTDAASAGSRGEQGFADVWWRGKFGWEYKRKDKHKSLDAAYRQLCQYREALDNPPLLVVSDITRIVIHTNFTNTAKQTHEITLEALRDDPAALDKLRRIFTDPESFRPEQTPEAITTEVADRIGTLARGLRGRGHEPHAAAHFLMKCMFCLFAEDVDLLPEQLFTRLLQGWQAKPAELTARLTDLFQQMSGGGAFGTDSIPHFNGGLFDDSPALELTGPEIGVLLLAARQDWSQVEPSIFGTLFERSLDPSKRSQIGAHYTSREDILLVVEPVVMKPLRERWAEVQGEVEKQRERRQSVKTAATKRKANQAIEDALGGFLNELAKYRILDPACGSGNFLYVAIQQLLGLEKEVITYAAAPGIEVSLLPTVRPTQLHGLEINPYAAELAQVVIWIGYLQWMRANGFNVPHDPILEPIETIGMPRCDPELGR